MSAQFGTLLKHWRDIRRYSQLALSHDSGFSSRHISFLETGRSQPSRSSILALANTLDMPKTAVNEALRAAGFAPEFPRLEMSEADMVPLNAAMDTILDNHAPFPAIIIDGDWNIVGANPSAQAMMGVLPFKGSVCIIDALLNDDPDTPIFENWADIATWTALRLQMELGKAGEHKALREHYLRLTDDPRLSAPEVKSFSEYGPILTMRARIGERTLSLFTMLAEFSTARDITMSERRVELFFAADEETREFFEAFRT